MPSRRTYQRAGQTVSLEQLVARDELDGAVRLAAHRIIQEALTNAMKHAPCQPTAVAVREVGDVITIEVVTRAVNGRRPMMPVLGV